MGLAKDSEYVSPWVKSVFSVSRGVAIVTPSTMDRLPATVLSWVTSYPLVVKPVKISDAESRKLGVIAACDAAGSHKLIAAGNEISSTT